MNSYIKNMIKLTLGNKCNLSSISEAVESISKLSGNRLKWAFICATKDNEIKKTILTEKDIIYFDLQ